jgi:hypothetical protein
MQGVVVRYGRLLIGIEFDYRPSINHAYMQLKGGKSVTSTTLLCIVKLLH